MKRYLIPAALFFAPLLQAAEEVKASHILVATQDEADLVRNEIIEKGGNRQAFGAAARKYSMWPRCSGSNAPSTIATCVRNFGSSSNDRITI